MNPPSRITSLPAELLGMITELVDLEDFEAFVLSCKTVYIASVPYIQAHKERLQWILDSHSYNSVDFGVPIYEETPSLDDDLEDPHVIHKKSTMGSYTRRPYLCLESPWIFLHRLAQLPVNERSRVLRSIKRIEIVGFLRDWHPHTVRGCVRKLQTDQPGFARDFGLAMQTEPYLCQDCDRVGGQLFGSWYESAHTSGCPTNKPMEPLRSHYQRLIIASLPNLTDIMVSGGWNSRRLDDMEEEEEEEEFPDFFRLDDTEFHSAFRNVQVVHLQGNRQPATLSSLRDFLFPSLRELYIGHWLHYYPDHKRNACEGDERPEAEALEGQCQKLECLILAKGDAILPQFRTCLPHLPKLSRLYWKHSVAGFDESEYIKRGRLEARSLAEEPLPDFDDLAEDRKHGLDPACEGPSVSFRSRKPHRYGVCTWNPSFVVRCLLQTHRDTLRHLALLQVEGTWGHVKRENRVLHFKSFTGLTHLAFDTRVLRPKQEEIDSLPPLIRVLPPSIEVVRIDYDFMPKVQDLKDILKNITAKPAQLPRLRKLRLRFHVGPETSLEPLSAYFELLERDLAKAGVEFDVQSVATTVREDSGAEWWRNPGDHDCGMYLFLE